MNNDIEDYSLPDIEIEQEKCPDCGSRLSKTIEPRADEYREIIVSCRACGYTESETL